MFGVYQIAANTAFVVRLPNERRAQAFGIASMGVIVGQGAAFVAAGAAAEVVAPAVVIAVGGGLGTVVAYSLMLRWRHVSPPGGRHAASRSRRCQWLGAAAGIGMAAVSVAGDQVQVSRIAGSPLGSCVADAGCDHCQLTRMIALPPAVKCADLRSLGVCTPGNRGSSIHI
jgi:hypothetical protein